MVYHKIIERIYGCKMLFYNTGWDMFCADEFSSWCRQIFLPMEMFFPRDVGKTTSRGKFILLPVGIENSVPHC